MNRQNGFTLVELAIVLMIIGLLIGGVLRGQELLQNAQITGTIQQVKAYQGATVTFMDSYNNFPGDMALASARLPGCQAGNANSCANGNGDTIIGTPSTSYAWSNIDPSITSENTQFWKHLALSHLISGVTPSAATPEWGKSHPVAKIRGGFFVRDAPNFDSGTVMFPSGHYLVIRNTISGNWVCGNAGGNLEQACTLSPQRASQIDRKMDDGIAYGGDVYAVSSNSTAGCGYNNQGENGPNGYAEGKTQPSCDMMFRFK